MGPEMSESRWMLFAIIVWSTVLFLFILVLRLVRGRPFFKRPEKRRGPHDFEGH